MICVGISSIHQGCLVHGGEGGIALGVYHQCIEGYLDLCGGYYQCTGVFSALGFIISELGTYQQCIGDLSSVHSGLIISRNLT